MLISEGPFKGLPQYYFRTLLVDPPWRFNTWSQTRQTRAASNHYSIMSTDDIASLPIADLAAKDCCLFLWAISPMLPHALDVIRRLGFTYKTVAFTWAKTTPTSNLEKPKWHVGLGYWTRANTELCLLGTRGKPKRLAKNVRQLLVDRRREHSRKPDEAIKRIEALTAGPYLELFARVSRPGWMTWGDEVGKFLEGTAKPQSQPLVRDSDVVATSIAEAA